MTSSAYALTGSVRCSPTNRQAAPAIQVTFWTPSTRCNVSVSILKFALTFMGAAVAQWLVCLPADPWVLGWFPIETDFINVFEPLR